jgi:hypothetical protein
MKVWLGVIRLSKLNLPGIGPKGSQKNLSQNQEF